MAKIAASIAKFGWTEPCFVAEDGELVAGHGGVRAAAMLGLTEAPVIVLGQLCYPLNPIAAQGALRLRLGAVPL